MENVYKKKIGTAAAWSSITEVLAKLITPLVNMILARLLAPEAFGVVATVTMVISFTEIFTDAGFQKYIVQHEFADREALDKSTNVAFWTNLCVSGLVCLVIFLFRHQIAALVGSPGLGNTISIASTMILLAAFSSIQMARYKRDFDFKTLFFARIGTVLIPLVITIPLALWRRDYWALLIGNFAGKLYNAIVLRIKSQWRPSGYYSFRLLKEMFSYSAWMLAESIAVWFTTYVGVFIVGNYLDDHYLGLYKTSMTLVDSYMAIITASIMPVLFSALSRYQDDGVQFHNTFYKFQKMASLLILPMGVGIWVFSDLVTVILLGTQWLEAAPFVGLWGLTSTVTIVFSHFASEVYRSKGQPRLSMAMQLLHIAFVVPTLLLTLDQEFSVLYTARSLMRLQMAVTSMLVMQWKFDFKIADTLKNVWPACLASMIMGVLGWVLKPMFDSVIWQFAVIAICVVVYFGLLRLLFPKICKEFLCGIINIIHKRSK